MIPSLYRLTGYSLQAEDHSSPSSREYPELQWGRIWPTVEGAEEAIRRIITRERRRFERGLAATAPQPARVKKAWDDGGGAVCLVEYRIAAWTVDWSRDSEPGRSAVSRAVVRCEVEQRCAWREVHQTTQTTAAGLVVTHELGAAGEWTDWHQPFGGPGRYGPYVPHIDLSVVPHVLTIEASKRDIAEWARRTEDHQ